MNKWIKTSLLTVLIGVVIAMLFLWTQKQKQKAQELPKFRTQQIDRGAITQVVMATGTLQPVTTVNIGTQVSGTVSERLVDFNDRVTKGQVLLKLDPALIQARIRQAKAQLASAEASLTLALANHERNLGLQSQGFIAGAVLEQSKREAQAARANVEVARAQLDASTTDLNNSIIRSPIDGIVIKRNADVGQTVAASFQTPDLFQIAQDLKQMQIYTSVSEADVGLIKKAQPVRFFVDAYPEREFEGKVEQFRLNHTSTAGVVTYIIVVGVDNPEELLKPGMTAQTRIVVASKPDVIRIPTAALRFTPEEDLLPQKKQTTTENKTEKKEGSSSAEIAEKTKTDPKDDGVFTSTKVGSRLFRVYTVGKDNTPKLHEVTIGISNSRFTEMASGDLKVKDAVITRALSAPSSFGSGND